MGKCITLMQLTSLEKLTDFLILILLAVSVPSDDELDGMSSGEYGYFRSI